MTTPLLDVQNLTTQFQRGDEVVRAVQGVSFTLQPGEVLGLVGESGSGKSVTALSLLRLVQPPGRIVDGAALFKDGERTYDLLRLSPDELTDVRGHRISMIFQDPMTSLNPVLTIGYQITEPLRLHAGMSSREAETVAVDLLDRVGIPEPRRRLTQYPHQFSGGMRQRVMIAMALACRPRLLIADEPTTALDVTIQAQIVGLLSDLARELHTSVIIITHDLGVVAQLADRVAVMYAGRIIENGSVASIFDNPQHPYTRALLNSVPRLHHLPTRLHTIEGAPPDLAIERSGCAFEPRCPDRIARCAGERPPLRELERGHACACWVAQMAGQEVTHA